MKKPYHRRFFTALGASLLFHVLIIGAVLLFPLRFGLKTLTSPLKSAPLQPLAPLTSGLAQKLSGALEESLNETIALNSKAKLNQIAFGKESQVKSEKKKPSLFASRPPLTKEEMGFSPDEPTDFTNPLPPLFDLDQELAGDLSLPDDWEDFSLGATPSCDLTIDFPKGFEKNTPIQTPSIHDDYNCDQTFQPQILATEPNISKHLSQIATLEPLQNLQKLEENDHEMSEGQMLTTFEESTTPKLVLPNSVQYLTAQWAKRSLAAPYPKDQLPSLEHYGIGQIATSLRWQEDLDVTFSLMSAKQGENYVFSLKIEPKPHSNWVGMKQNFYFIIDRTSSIKPAKLRRFKRAVVRSLSALRSNDSFNISFVDKKVSTLFTSPKEASVKTILQAEEFLEAQEAKTHFAAGEIFHQVDHILPKQFAPDQVHSVILITDGQTSLNPQKQQKALNHWIEKYQGKVQFYPAAAGRGNNLVLLDLVGHITGGKLTYSDTNAGFPRKLVHLVKDLHFPILKNLTIDLVPKDGNANISFHPKRSKLPPLFADKPYTLCGTIDELCNLTLFIQGENHKEALNLHKQIPLGPQMKKSRLLEKLWAETQSKICYDLFLINGNKSHLQEAVQIVTPHRGIIASDQ